MKKYNMRAAQGGGKRVRDIMLHPRIGGRNVMCPGPCSNWTDFQSQIDARPALRGNPPTVSIARVCRVYHLRWRAVIRAIQRGEMDAVMVRGILRATLESARARFGKSRSSTSSCRLVSAKPKRNQIPAVAQFSGSGVVS